MEQVKEKKKLGRPKMNADRHYEFLKAAWIATHPDATAREYEQAMLECARKAGV